MDILRQFQAADTGSPQQDAAAQRMEAYKAKLAQAKQQWQAGGGEIRFGKLDAYLKQLEREQFFNGI
jgi:hypothetical protein